VDVRKRKRKEKWGKKKNGPSIQLKENLLYVYIKKTKKEKDTERLA